MLKGHLALQILEFSLKFMIENKWKIFKNLSCHCVCVCARALACVYTCVWFIDNYVWALLVKKILLVKQEWNSDICRRKNSNHHSKFSKKNLGKLLVLFIALMLLSNELSRYHKQFYTSGFYLIYPKISQIGMMF